MTLLRTLRTYKIPVHTATEGWDVLRLAVEKHTFPSPNPKPILNIAFLWSHGAGFHKELLHPLMRRFSEQLRLLQQFNNVNFDFYAWDTRYHGDSAIASKGSPSPRTVSWYEVGLDTLKVVDHFQMRQRYDKVVGVGHSLGATSILLAEYMYPKTFDAICAIEPAIRDKVLDYKISSSTKLKHTIQRRDTWPDRTTCLKSIRSRPFWKSWDEEALAKFVNHGLYETKEGTVKLKCQKEHESLFYECGVNSYGPYCYFQTLSKLTIPTHMVLASDISVDTLIRALPENIKSQSPVISTAVLEGTHMLPFENPGSIVPELVQFTNNVCQGQSYT